MTRWLREFRLVPVVLTAAGSLLVLKVAGLVLDGGYTLGQRLGSSDTLVVTRVPMPPTQELQIKTVPLEIISQQNQGPKRSWMQEMFNYPGGGNVDVTGSIHGGGKPAEKPAAEKPAEAEKPKPKVADPSAAELKAGEGKVVEVEQKQSSSPAERALLERLQARREELDKRARELDLRETMLKAAEKKLDPPAAAKAGEGKPDGNAEKKDSPETTRMKALVTMYETMKPKDAAKIFDRLDPKILIEVASQMKPQVMASVLAVMSPEAAERLTVELATRSGAEKTNDPLNLPKIEGRP
jgi:flagellar motility protein MotE (MotC chaperone)